MARAMAGPVARGLVTSAPEAWVEVLREADRARAILLTLNGWTSANIAEVFGVTESRICQIHAQAILAIKAYLRKHEASDE